MYLGGRHNVGPTDRTILTASFGGQSLLASSNTAVQHDDDKMSWFPRLNIT